MKCSKFYRKLTQAGMLVGGLVLLITAAGAQSATDQALLASIDAQVSFLETDFSAEYTITQERAGQAGTSQVAAVLRRDKADTYTIIITAPAVDKGKGYLKIGNNLWFYDPQTRKFQVTSARDRFQNSNARNADFTRSTLALDYQVVGRSAERYETWDTVVLELRATNNDVAYPRMKLWVSADNLVRKSEDYDLSGKLLRTTLIPVYQKLGNRAVPLRITMVDALEGRLVSGQFQGNRTVIDIAKPSTKALPDMVFTQAYLERVGR